MSVTELVQETVAKIDKELEELRPAKEKFEELEAFKMRVTSASGRATRPRATRAGSTPASPGHRQGGRLEQYLELVSAEPGITVSQVAAKLGMQPNYVYKLRNQATEANQVRVEDGKMYRVPANGTEPVGAAA